MANSSKSVQEKRVFSNTSNGRVNFDLGAHKRAVGFDEEKFVMANVDGSIEDMLILTVEARLFSHSGPQDNPWVNLVGENGPEVRVYMFKDDAQKYWLLSNYGDQLLLELLLTPFVVVSLSASNANFVTVSDLNSDVMYGLEFRDKRGAEVFTTKCSDIQSTLSLSNFRSGGEGRSPAAVVPRVDQAKANMIAVLVEPTSPANSNSTLPAANSNQKGLDSKIRQLESALSKSSVVVTTWKMLCDKLQKENAELKANLEKMVYELENMRHDTVRPPAISVSTQTTFSQVGDQAIPSGSSSQANQALSLITEQARVESNNVSPSRSQLDSGAGGEGSNRVVAVEIQKNINEKLSELVMLHKILKDYL